MRVFTISVGAKRTAARWSKRDLDWAAFLAELKIPTRTRESFAQYCQSSRDQKLNIKDVGGFVAGSLERGRRLKSRVLSRSMITLDLDQLPGSAALDGVVSRLEGLGCAAAMYSTHSHTPDAPRVRVIVPLARDVTPDEYEPIARRIADDLGMAYADPTTYEVARLMFWPSASRDQAYLYRDFTGDFLDPDTVLARYADWRDVASWPRTEHDRAPHKAGTAVEDPLTKKGAVGTFCRAYGIRDAIATFLGGIYTPCDTSGDRYTYKAGSTVGGAVVYEDKWLYSHHATDPAGGALLNSFDLVRLSLYGGLDTDTDVPVTKTASYQRMMTLCQDDAGFRVQLAEDNQVQLTQLFSRPDASTEAEDNWAEALVVSKNGRVKNTIHNMALVLSKSPTFCGAIAQDEFGERTRVLRRLPWDEDGVKIPRDWTEVDDAQLARYMETAFDLSGNDKMAKALTIAAYGNRYNDVVEYLMGLAWDGVRRLDTIFADYLGAEDNLYTQAVARKSFTAAVARAMCADGVKYDYMPILYGAQGIGKSTLLKKMGRDWFSDSLQAFEGKEAAELLRGVWINELGELTGLSKAETNAVKQFLSKIDDIYREAYGRRSKRYPRRCVFFGTTNQVEVLRDLTGNRRFWPVDCGITAPKKDVFTDLDDDVDQLWAEAYMYYVCGEPLYLTGPAAEMALEAQEAHMQDDPRIGVIAEFLDTPIPDNWIDLPAQTRRMYITGQMSSDRPLVSRDRVSAVEIWVECFGNRRDYITKRDAAEINQILDSLPGWTRGGVLLVGGNYGKQRIFKRIN